MGRLPKPVVPCFGLLQDGYLGIRVFPKREKILIRGACSCLVALKYVDVSQVEISNSTDRLVTNGPAMGNDLLKFGRGRRFWRLQWRPPLWPGHKPR
jgi:hypothetical protein